MRVERRDINRIVPYWRNPRRITETAVEQLARSISQYGYQQPIVVDEQNVIIAGHTRYAALRKLGADHVDVIVARHLTPEQVNQLRIIDNRSGEYSSWDFDKLSAELEDPQFADDPFLKAAFPEILGAPADAISYDPHAEQSELPWAEQQQQSGQSPEVDFVCPSCFHEWTVTVTREHLATGRIGPDAAQQSQQ